jgi:hypothetical protein
MKRSDGAGRSRRLIAGALIALAAFGAGWALLWRAGLHREDAADQRSDREHPIVTAPRIVEQGGRRVIRLDATALQRAAIRTEAVQRGAQPESVRALGTVIDLQPLVELSASARATAAQLAAAQAKLAASRAEYERARRLFDDQQNVSAAQLQSAQAAFEADQSALAAHQAQVDANRASARLGWGPSLADALVATDPRERALADDLLARRLLLLQVTLGSDPANERAPPEGRVLLDRREGPSIRLLGPAARADARLAGRSFLYRTAPDPALLAGSNVAVRLATGRTIDAARIPASALVWWQGRAWIFVRTAAGDFERREIPVERVRDGSTLLADLDNGTAVVVQGAQVLLSEELRAENSSTDVGGR